MRIIKCGGMLVLFVSVGLWAQNVPAVAIENKLDTPQVHVYVATLPPNTPRTIADRSRNQSRIGKFISIPAL